MHYVYIIQSAALPEKFYTGQTSDLERRIAEHNRHRRKYSSRYKPWKLRTYFAFDLKDRAIAFERYLKTPNGRALAKKRF